jgi:predicted DCC family thiol-disulfide oxidoreductase YuxK
MQSLFVFYDGECGLCAKARATLARMAQRVPLVFVAYQDPQVLAVFPALTRLDPDRQVIAMSDSGDIYQGDSAWITILWALRDYRGWAIRLARPGWRRHAKAAVHYLSMNRRRLSARLGLRP